MTYLKSHLNLPGTNELTMSQYWEMIKKLQYIYSIFVFPKKNIKQT